MKGSDILLVTVFSVSSFWLRQIMEMDSSIYLTLSNVFLSISFISYLDVHQGGVKHLTPI